MPHIYTEVFDGVKIKIFTKLQCQTIIIIIIISFHHINSLSDLTNIILHAIVFIVLSCRETSERLQAQREVTDDIFLIK